MSGRGQITLTRGGRAHRGVQVTALVALLAVALWLPLYFPSHEVFRLTQVLVFVIAVLSVNLLTGYTGQISLGHNFFFALGAYTSAIMLRDLEISFVIPILVAFAISFVVGFLVGIPALRLTGIYLALVTVALGVITSPVITRFSDLTGGSMGISVDQPSAPGWTGLADDQWLYYVCLVPTILVLVVGRNLVQGATGRSMTAVRDNELAARTMGINPAVPRTLIFAYSAGLAGVAGALYSLAVGFIAPGSFTLILAIYLLVGTVVGGMASIAGAVFGAAFIIYVPIYTSGFDPALGGVLYGVVLIVLMLCMPGGVMGLIRRAATRFVVLVEPDQSRRGGPERGTADSTTGSSGAEPTPHSAGPLVSTTSDDS